MTEDEHDYVSQLLEQFLCEREQTLDPEFIDTPEEFRDRMIAIANHFRAYCKRYGVNLPDDLWKEENKKLHKVIKALASRRQKGKIQ